MIDHFCTSQYHLQNKMKNLSLQITSPKFLDDSFTTQMDLLTGKVFYHSQLGEYLNMLPPIISDAIEKGIWKFIFSRKVLAIPHPIHIDYCDDHTMKQDIQPYIDRHIRHCELEEKYISAERKVGYEEKMVAAKSIQPIDVMNAERHNRNKLPNNGWAEYHSSQVKLAVDRGGTFPTINDVRVGVENIESNRCHWFNKNGCMCGIGETRYIEIPECLYDKYAPLNGKCGFIARSSHPKDWNKHVVVNGCSNHLKEIRSSDHPSLTRTLERILDEYLEQHNYHLRNGCWVKGHPQDGYTWDKTRKHVKKVPYNKYKMVVYKTQELSLLPDKPKRHYHREVRYEKEVYHPKLSKRLEKKVS